MPALSTNEAVERLAKSVEQAKPTSLSEVYSELFPDKTTPRELSTSKLAEHIRKGLLVEEIVDLWNVIFPADRNVWFDEADEKIHYNEETIYAEIE